MNLTFFGNGSVAVPALQLLVKQPWCVVQQVVTRSATPIDLLARQLNLNITYTLGEALAGTAGVVVDYGQLIPEPIITQYPLGIVNIHPSLLPRWRGPSPVQFTLLNNDQQAGVSLMLIDAGMDTGLLLAQQSYPVTISDECTSLEPRLAQFGAELLVVTLPKYQSGELKPYPQSVNGITLSKKLQRSDGELTKQLTDLDKWNHYRALQPWPGTFFYWQGKRIKVITATYTAGQFKIQRLQMEGKKAISLAEFKIGYPTCDVLSQ